MLSESCFQGLWVVRLDGMDRLSLDLGCLVGVILALLVLALVGVLLLSHDVVGFRVLEAINLVTAVAAPVLLLAVDDLLL